MLRDVVDLLDLDQEVLGVVDVLLNASALLALDEDLDGAVWQPQQLDDGPERADAVDVFLARIVRLRVLLGGKQNVLLLVHRIFQRLDGLLATDEQRHHHVGEDDDVAQAAATALASRRRPDPPSCHPCRYGTSIDIRFLGPRPDAQAVS